MQALIAVIFVPILALNTFGGIVSGIWLAIQGQWAALGFGLLALMFTTFLLSLALTPGLLLAAPGMLLAKRGHIVLSMPFVFATQLYYYAVIAAWCAISFAAIMAKVSEHSFWPSLIWSYGVALGPWMYMASKEPDPESGSSITVFFAQVAYLAASVVLIFSRQAYLRHENVGSVSLTFFGILLVGVFANSIFAFVMMREHARHGMAL